MGFQDTLHVGRVVPNGFSGYVACVVPCGWAG